MHSEVSLSRPTQVSVHTDIANVTGSYAEYRFVTYFNTLHVYNYWVDTLWVLDGTVNRYSVSIE